MRYPYSLRDVKSSPRGGVTAELVEDAVAVAKVTRRAGAKNFAFPFEVKFLSEKAKYRFSDYCDSLSFDEVIEILYVQHQKA